MLTALLIGLCASAITVNKAEIRQKYCKREVMIPMRDGVRLSTAIYEPAEPREGGSPVIMMNILPCIGLCVFALLVARMKEE